MKRLSILVFSALVLAAPLLQAAELKIGFVQTERIFREASPAQKSQRKLEKEFADRDASLQRLAKQTQELQNQLTKDGATMSGRTRQPWRADSKQP